MKKYLTIVEKTRTGYSAFCPDLPGCIATAKTRSAVERRMQSAIAFHIEGMKEEGLKIPAPKSYSTYLQAKAA